MRRHVGDDAGERRRDDRVVELALRLVDLCLGLHGIADVLSPAMSGLPPSLASCTCACCAQGGKLALVVVERVARLIVDGLGDRGAAQQHGVAVEVDLIEVDLRLLRGGVAHHALVVLLHRLDRQRGLRQIGLGVVERDLELTRIEPIEHLPGVDVLIVLDRDVLHDARDIGGNADLLGLHIGIVGRHDLAAGHIEITADEQRNRQQRKQRPAHAIAAPRPPPFVATAVRVLERVSAAAPA